ncbi:MAG: hypothetical protein AAFX78_03545 [Cyanobacteria bacterium J06638_20]
MAFTFDASTKRITETAEPGNPAVVDYNLFTDLFVPLADWWVGGNLSINFPFREEGGNLLYRDNLNNPVYGPTVFFLQNQLGQGWRIVPANYDHEIRFVAASFLPQVDSTPLFDLTGITAKVIFRPDLALAQAGYFLSGDGGSGGNGDATAANQATILTSISTLDAKVVELQNRLTPTRAANLDSIPVIADDTAALARGDISVDTTTNTLTLRKPDGTAHKIFNLTNENDVATIVGALQRTGQ